MHELALVEGVLSVVLDASGGEKIRHVHVQAGGLQMVVQDSFQFAFELLSENTVADDAEVSVEILPVQLRCRKCSAETESEAQPFGCISCGGTDIELLSGMELIVQSIELVNGKKIETQVVDLGEMMAQHMKEHIEHDWESY